MGNKLHEYHPESVRLSFTPALPGRRMVEEGPAERGPSGFALVDDARYRTELHRELSASNRREVLWVMLNPSTADARRDDPTIRRVVALSARPEINAGRMTVVNLYAARTPYPRELARMLRAAAGREEAVIGEGNDARIEAYAARADVVVAAWGVRAPELRAAAVLRILVRAAPGRIVCVGRTKSGQPRHPLTVRGAVEIEPYPPAAATVEPPFDAAASYGPGVTVGGSR